MWKKAVVIQFKILSTFAWKDWGKTVSWKRFEPGTLHTLPMPRSLYT
jgi:hypothetical protein